MTAWTGPQPCSRIQAAARLGVAETALAFSAGVDFAVRQAGAIVNHADDLDLPRMPGLVLLSVLTGRPVSRPIELRQLERVDVQQRACLGPFVALGGLRALGVPPSRHTVTREHLVDCRG